MNAHRAVAAIAALLVAVGAGAQYNAPAAPGNVPYKVLTPKAEELKRLQVDKAREAAKKQEEEKDRDDKAEAAAKHERDRKAKMDAAKKDELERKANAEAAARKAIARRPNTKADLVTRLQSRPAAAQIQITTSEHNHALESYYKAKTLLDSKRLDPKIIASVDLTGFPMSPKSSYTPKELEVIQRVVQLTPKLPDTPLLLPSPPPLVRKTAAITLPGAPTPLAPEEENEVKSSRNNDDELKKRLAAAQRGAAPDSGNPVRGRRVETFNPLGFLEVVLIVAKGNTCTGTLVNAQVVLTAAHCVNNVPIASVEVRIPRFDRAMLEACRAAWKNEQRYIFCADLAVAKPFAIDVHKSYDERTFANDVALITLETPDYERSTAGIRFYANIPARLTLAGYGETLLPDKSDYRSRFAMEVGWHSGDTVRENNGLIEWISHKDDAESSTCSGDSGGPIFSGDNIGIGDTPRPRAVFAIVSNATSSKCQDYTVRQTMLSSTRVKEWLCERLSSWLGECSLPLVLSGELNAN